MSLHGRLTVDVAAPPAPIPTRKESAERQLTVVEAHADSQVLADVEHVLRHDHHGAVDLRRVITAVWTRRADKEFTAELCARIPLLNVTKHLLDQAEFFLPQLAHMIIHFDKELPVEPLERFVLMVSQSSIHLALQFFWTVYATLDENRPKRAGANPRTFARCAQLLLAIEQCVVYGTLAPEEEKLVQTGSSKDLMASENVGATEAAPASAVHPLPKTTAIECVGRKSGWLLKKGGGTSTMGRRNWSQRWCRIENRILLVFNKPTDAYPRAAVPISGAEIVLTENPKHRHYFEIIHSLSETCVKFAALSEQDFTEWVEALKRTASAPEPPAGSSPIKAPGSPSRAISRMSFAMRSFLLDSASSNSIVGTNPEVGATNGGNDVRSGEPVGPGEPQQELKDSRDHSNEQVLEEMDPYQPEPPNLQANRSEFFTGMIRFVKSITDVAEVLRKAEPLKRKMLLQPQLEKIKIPLHAYIPLCKSTDPFCAVHAILTTEGRVFNTNERAPCLLYFETVERMPPRSVAQTLFKDFYDPSCIYLEDDENTEGDVEDRSEGTDDGEATEADKTTLHHSFLSHIPIESAAFVSALLADKARKKQIEQIFGELSFSSTERLRSTSTCDLKFTPQWRLTTLIAKSFDDLRQEVLVMQLLSFFQQIFEQEGLPLWLRPYRILSTGASTGLIEVIQNATSLDSIKKTPGFKNLRGLFDQVYGNEDVEQSEPGDHPSSLPLRRQAELNFIHSLAAYSIVCYILAVKDRHNGNIMLDIEGHIMHIDFGFFLGRAPGGSFSFETAPFKLTAEMVEVLGGRTSSNFEYFSELCARGALAIRKHADTLYVLVETMSTHSKMPCFAGGAVAPLAGLRERLFLNMPEEKVRPAIKSMIQRAYDHFGTNKYDQFQVYSNGIAK